MPVRILAVFSVLTTLAGAEAPDPLRAAFLNPPAEARAHTWWHWMNGNVTREGITADLESMAASHLGGATLFNIAGPHHNCDIPPGPADYLGPLWLDLLEHAASEAGRLGLELGMQNCAGWATTGGPWITPELGMQELVSSELVILGGRRIQQELPQPEAVLGHYRDVALFALPADLDSDFRMSDWESKAGQRGGRSGRQPELKRLPEGAAIPRQRILELTDKLTKDGTLTWEAPDGSWKLIRIGHTAKGNTNKPAPAAGTGLEIDKLRREGLDVHWQKGIQPVLDRLGDRVGRVFTEILIDSYEAGLHHWTPKMREEFTARRGYDPGPYLLALTGRAIDDGPSTDRFYWDFRRTIADLINENYYGYMAELCHKHGLKLAAEPYTSCFEGMQAGARADLPMGEFWVDGSYTSTLRTAASIAHTTGRRIAAAEAFTASPELGRWQNHPASLKLVGDHAWATGINRLILHGWPHQPWLDLNPGMTMGQYGCHFGRTNTWWKPGRAWLAYIARSQFLLQFGEPATDVLCFAGNAAPNGSIHMRALEQAGYGYDSCSSEALLSLTVDDGEIVLPTGARYQLLALPDNSFHTPEHARKLRELVAAGAQVHGPRPQQTPSLESFPASEKEVAAIGNEVWGETGTGETTSNSFGKGRVFHDITPVEALKQLGIPPQVVLPDGLSWIQRHDNETDIYFVSNQSDQAISTLARFRSSGRIPEIWDAETAAISHPTGWADDGNQTSLPLDLLPGKSAFIVFQQSGNPHGDPVLRVEAPAGTGIQPDHQCDHPGAFRVWSPGSHSLHHASGKSTRREVSSFTACMALDGPWQLGFQAGRGAPETATMETLIPLETHNDPGIHRFSGTCSYRIGFDYQKPFDPKRQELWLDLGDVQVIAEVTLNGSPLGTLWHPPYRVQVTDAIQQGNNVLEVAVTNLWINRLIGDAQLPDDCEWTGKALTQWPDWLTQKKPRPGKRQAFATWNHWGADEPLRPSGLVGPVILREARVIGVE